MSAELFISYSQGRNFEWKGHNLRGVRQAIRQDKGSGRLRLFTLDVAPSGQPARYSEVPRERWAQLFGGGGA